MPEWIALLDAKIAAPENVGDRQVNWLVAHARSQELVRNPSKHFPVRWSVPASWPMDGMKYLKRAYAAAQSPSVKVRVAQEIVARLSWDNEPNAANALVDDLSHSLPSDQTSTLAAWHNKIATIAAAHSPQAQSLAARQSYLKTLQLRRARQPTKVMPRLLVDTTHFSKRPRSNRSSTCQR